MKPWKIGLHLVAACAACCAIPLLAAAGGLGALGAALWACASEPGVIALGVASLALAAGLAWRWHRQRRCGPQAAGCGCAGSCAIDPSNKRG